MLYVKLLLIIINLQITFSVQYAFIEADKIRIPSLNKSLKTLKTLFHDLFGILRQTWPQAAEKARKIERLLEKNHWIESKKNKEGLPEILRLFICKQTK